MKSLAAMFAVMALLLVSAGVAAAGHDNGYMEYFENGRWFEGVMVAYTQVLGPAFHVFLFLIGPVLIGIRYQRLVPAAMALLVAGIVFASFFPADLQFMFGVFAILGVAAILYGVTRK